MQDTLGGWGWNGNQERWVSLTHKEKTIRVHTLESYVWVGWTDDGQYGTMTISTKDEHDDDSCTLFIGLVWSVGRSVGHEETMGRSGL